MSEPTKRRRRPAVTGDCVYEARPVESPERLHGASPALTTGAAGQWKKHQSILPNHNLQTDTARSSLGSLHSSPKSTQSPPEAAYSHESEAKRLRLRIRELEDQLSRVSMESSGSSPLASVSSSIETTTSKLGGVFHVQCDTPIGNGGPVIARSMMHKTRMFGQSHWCVTGVLLIRDIFETIDDQLQERGAEAWAGIARCKVLARFIKGRRAPPWPPLRTSSLPERSLADALVKNYLENTELLYRVLHIPTFRARYDALWAPGTTPDPAFLVQVKLVLALGAVTYDEAFSLRTCAMQWAYEAQTWLAEPKFKARLDVQTVQTNILLLFAQERLGIVADAMWTEVGLLVRRAMYMGLHRDPARLPDRTVLTCEMHRRLWNTICELNLQSSLGSGGPVFLSMSDFDTQAPGNFDDEQLLEIDPVPRPQTECTQMTMALALRETFSQRLDVLRFLNDVSSGGSYEETLRLDAQLRASYKKLGRRLQSCRGQGAKPSLTSAELRILDIIMYRYLTALHVPYFVAAMQEAKYAYSRVVVVDCALKVWSSLAGSTSIDLSDGQSPFEAADDLRRQVTRGMSFFMIAAMHSALLIVMELRAQLKESDGLGPKLLRPDLLAVLGQSQQWALEVIKAGHTNIKGYLLLRIIAVHIDGMSRGLSQEGLVENLLMAATEVSETCGGLLTEMAEQLTGGDSSVIQAAAAPMPTPPETSGEWAFTGLDDLLASTETKAEGWPAGYGYSMDEFEWAMFDA
ncbi:C6 transcription factor [Cordyceps javanica]|uniref:C6 transcription factor n=1 Tax=Cordyceps javanica TaxID=43265 RepID=A0A545VLS1_9HYPO|nr:C6 transcription factor [Cordyceps javanica]TQW02679.1 C6 transcription factor [Cordyceps javanica]